MSSSVSVPTANGIVHHQMGPARSFPRPGGPFTTRTIYAAPHVVADALAEYTPGETPRVDWERTIAFRQHLWSYGIGVAEAMDTSERGLDGLRWAQSRELISYSLDAAREVGGAIVSGAGTDQLQTGNPSLDAIVEAYLEQVEFIQSRGGRVILRVSHALAKAAHSLEDYGYVYDKVLTGCDQPAIDLDSMTAFSPAPSPRGRSRRSRW